MDILRKLKNTPGRTAKEYILSKEATEKDKKVLLYAYNPHYRFGIANITGSFSLLGTIDDEGFLLLDKLRNRELTGNAAREEVLKYREAYGSLITFICKKNLDCGASARTINKVFPGLIPEFNVQLAKEVPLDKLAFPLVGQIKYDGVRVITRCKPEERFCEFYTRNGKVINCPELRDIMLSYPYSQDNFMLDGEIVLREGKSLGRTTVSGRVNSALHGGELSLKDIQYKVFDHLFLDEFDSCNSARSYKRRYNNLKEALKQITYTKKLGFYPCLPDIISASGYKIFHTPQEVNKYYGDLLSKGYEGVILKSEEHNYTFKRSKDWVKMKSVKTADLLCTFINGGKVGTKYENKIGSLECQGMVEGNKVTVNVGSGLSDNDRELSFNNYLNKTIEVKYNEAIKNYTDTGYTLFLPRFVCVREDK